MTAHAWCRRALPWILGAIAVFGLILRFVWPGDTLFVADEPLFQILLDEHFRNGTFPLTSFRGSSIPLPYGAGALWIYGLFRLISEDVVHTAFLHTFVYAAGIALFGAVIRPLVSRESLLWTMALACTSPLLFLFSRHNWDNTFFVILTSSILLLRLRLETTPHLKTHLVLISLLLGYLPNIHLMSGPVVLAVGASLLFFIWKRESSWVARLLLVACAALPGILILVPYLWEAARLFEAEKNVYPRKPREWGGDLRNVWWLIHKQLNFFGMWKMKNQFAEVYPHFLDYSGAPWKIFFKTEIVAWIPKLFAVSYLFSIPFRCYRRRAISPIELVLGLSFFLFVLTINFMNIPTEAHYFHAVWWVPFAALALALDHWRNPKVLFTVKAFLLATIVVNTAFTWKYMWFVHENRGMRNFAHSTAVVDIRETAREICRNTPRGANGETREVKLFIHEVLVFAHPFRYFQTHLAECQGLRFEFPWDKSQSDWLLAYDASSRTDARLIVTKGKE